MTSATERVSFHDLGSSGAGTVTPDLSKGNYQRVTATAGTLTIANPIAGVRERPEGPTVVPVNLADERGRKLLVEVKATGGALTVTWGAAYKGPATAIGSATRRIFEFIGDGANWVVINPAGDVPN
jgi:hypothetical protein